MLKRAVGIIDCTPRRLPAEPRGVFEKLCLEPGLNPKKIRRSMIAEGFRMTLGSIEDEAARVRRKHGRPAGRRGRIASNRSPLDLDEGELRNIDELLRIPGNSPTSIFRARKISEAGIKYDTFLKYAKERRRTLGLADSGQGPRDADRRSYAFAHSLRSALLTVLDRRFVNLVGKHAYALALADLERRR